MDVAQATAASRALFALLIYAVCMFFSAAYYLPRLEESEIGIVDQVLIVLAVGTITARGVLYIVIDMLGLFPVVAG